jgi:hypothetical protein
MNNETVDDSINSIVDEINGTSLENSVHIESQSLQEQQIPVVVEQDNSSDDDYNTTNTSCSLNSDDCIDYDSDLSSTNSILFYSDSDDFIDNEFVRINHKPFMELFKNNTAKLNSIFKIPVNSINLNSGQSNTGEQSNTECENKNNSEDISETNSNYLKEHINMSTYIKQIDSKLFDDMNLINDRYKEVYKKIEEMISNE